MLVQSVNIGQNKSNCSFKGRGKLVPVKLEGMLKKGVKLIDGDGEFNEKDLERASFVILDSANGSIDRDIVCKGPIYYLKAIAHEKIVAPFMKAIGTGNELKPGAIEVGEMQAYDSTLGSDIVVHGNAKFVNSMNTRGLKVEGNLDSEGHSCVTSPIVGGKTTNEGTIMGGTFENGLTNKGDVHEVIVNGLTTNSGNLFNITTDTLQNEKGAHANNVIAKVSATNAGDMAGGSAQTLTNEKGATLHDVATTGMLTNNGKVYGGSAGALENGVDGEINGVKVGTFDNEGKASGYSINHGTMYGGSAVNMSNNGELHDVELIGNAQNMENGLINVKRTITKDQNGASVEEFVPDTFRDPQSGKILPRVNTVEGQLTNSGNGKVYHIWATKGGINIGNGELHKCTFDGNLVNGGNAKTFDVAVHPTPNNNHISQGLPLDAASGDGHAIYQGNSESHGTLTASKAYFCDKASILGKVNAEIADVGPDVQIESDDFRTSRQYHKFLSSRYEKLKDEISTKKLHEQLMANPGETQASLSITTLIPKEDIAP